MSEYYENVQKGNRYILHEYVAQHPAAAARAVHWTFDHCLRILFNTAPAATVSASEIHTDGVAARCEAGLIGHIQSYMGIVEPKMRKTEHLDKLIQVLGFTHPRDFFESGDFAHLFRQIWSFVASVSFTSQEACASHIDPCHGLETLSHEPLMPVFPAQVKK